ncbi:MAG: hypothetical protein AAF465_09990 [Pseudomonadota bacterium]
MFNHNPNQSVRQGGYSQARAIQPSASPRIVPAPGFVHQYREADYPVNWQQEQALALSSTNIESSVTDNASVYDQSYAESRRCQFNLLRASRDGVSDYHANSHIGFFRLRERPSVEDAVNRLFRHFPTIFSPGNSAVAVFSSCRYHGERTVKFTANVPGPDLHDDWVVMRKEPRYFFARTLERLWREPWETAASYAAPAFSPVLGRSGSNLAWVINRRHFLAGRRSWTFGYLPEHNLFFVETAALERYSHSIFERMEGPMGIRQQVIEIWAKLIENIAQHFSWRLVRHVPAGYRTRGRVAYRQGASRSARAIFTTGWYSGVLQRHPALSTY